MHDDLHAHTLSKHEHIDPKEVLLTIFLALVSPTKHNGGGVDSLNVASMSDDDKIDSSIKGRAGHRKKTKVLKDDERSRATGNYDK